MGSRVKIIPAVLIKNEEEFKKQLSIAEKFSDTLHLDVMNGSFIELNTWADPEIIAKINTDMDYELHLMIETPITSLPAWSTVKNVSKVIAHFEAFKKPEDADGGIKEFIEACKSFGWKVGLAINPETKPEVLLPYINQLDAVVIMMIHPGASGQKMMPENAGKIKILKELCKKNKKHCPEIEIDGGLKKDTLKIIKEAGANSTTANSAVFATKDPQTSFEELKKLS